MTSPSHLLHNLLLFGRLLRGLGLDVNTGRMMDLAQALAYIDLGRRADVYHAARSLLVHRREDLPLFDEAFEAFWRQPSENGLSLGLESIRRRPRHRQPLITAPPLREKPASEGDAAPEADQLPILQVTVTYSAREVLRQKDFADLTAEELSEIKQLMAHLVWQLGQRRTRRKRPGEGATLDWRRTLRGSLRYGGEVVQWAHRAPKLKPRPLVILADISGSMERYTRLLLHFLYSLTLGLHQPVETFLFGTRLTRVTRQLQLRSVDHAMREVSHHVTDWAGGTRIGASLKTFNFDWGRRVLGRGALVLLISDGWDRGEPELLQHEMERLHRSCQRLIWLNPLLGAPDYEPLTRGMQAALPHVDDFLPVHNLASLEDLARRLRALG